MTAQRTTATQPAKPIHFYLEGFSDSLMGLDALRARVAELKARHPDLIGKVCKVWIGKGNAESATFHAEPSALIVVGA